MTAPTDKSASPLSSSIDGPDSSPLLYQDESFVETQLVDPLKTLVKSALKTATSNDTTSTPLARMDSLEIALRSHLLELTTSLLQHFSEQKEGSLLLLKQVQEYWKSCLQLCLHLVYYAQKHQEDDNKNNNNGSSSYQGMGAAVVRKLPFVLLEDIVETLPLQLVQQLWTETVEPSIPLLCNDDDNNNLLWIKTSHLIWIRLCNKLLRKSTTRGESWAGRILLSLASVFPLSERSAMNVLGSFHTDNVTVYESLEEFTSQQQQSEQSDDTKDKQGQETKQGKAPLREDVGAEKDYAFYETFWSIQQDFSNPNGIRPLSDFVQKMQTILSVLESHAFSSDSQQHHKDDDSKSSSSQETTMTQSSKKYLTNSQLLHLQLRDAELRIHFLTQFFIIESYLVHTNKQAEKELLPVTKRAKDLLQRHTSGGTRHLETLEWLLQERESMWRTWKKNKCTPDLEKKATNEKTAMLLSSNNETTKSDDDTNNNQAQDDSLFHFAINVKEDLPAICKAMVQDVVPERVHDYLEDYVEALDPEAGIEPEYHPKHDKLFSWRSMRLLRNSHLGLFGMVRRRDGDFEGLVRHVYKTEKDQAIPGEEPEPNMDPLEEYEEPNKDSKKKETPEVSLSDDVSVGSPIETEEATPQEADVDKDNDKKKSMEEFEKAALEEEEEMMKEEQEEEKEATPAEKGNAKNEAGKRGDGKKEVAKKDNIKKNDTRDRREDEKQQQKPSSTPASTGRDHGRRGGRGGRASRSSPSRQSPPERGTKRRRSPDRGNDKREVSPDRGRRGSDNNSRRDDSRSGRDGGGRRERHDRDENRRGWSADDRGGKRRRHGGGRPSY